MSAHRYWRIANIINDGSATNTSIRDLEFRTIVGVAEFPTGGVGSSSGSGSDATSVNGAFDGNTITYWQRTNCISNGAISYDFGAGNEKDVLEVAITSWVGNECVRYADIQWSDDGTNWFNIYRIINSTGWTDNLTRTFVSYTDSPDTEIFVSNSSNAISDSANFEFVVSHVFDDSTSSEYTTEIHTLYVFGKHNTHITAPVSANYLTLTVL